MSWYDEEVSFEGVPAVQTKNPKKYARKAPRRVPLSLDFAMFAFDACGYSISGASQILLRWYRSK